MADERSVLRRLEGIGRTLEQLTEMNWQFVPDRNAGRSKVTPDQLTHYNEVYEMYSTLPDEHDFKKKYDSDLVKKGYEHVNLVYSKA